MTAGRIRVAVATLVATPLLLLVSACADQEPSDAGSADPAPASDGPTPGDDDGGGSLVAIDSITVERGGGITGDTVTYQLKPGDPGFDKVMVMAAQLPRDQQGEIGETPCCDIYRYALTVHYASGDVGRFSTYDGDGGPVLDVAMAVLSADASNP